MAPVHSQDLNDYKIVSYLRLKYQNLYIGTCNPMTLKLLDILDLNFHPDSLKKSQNNTFLLPLSQKF